MNYLLDVNVLLAWGWADHGDHTRAAKWVAEMKQKRGNKLLTSAIPELGFVRVSLQRAAGKLAVNDAASILASMIDSLGKCHEFVADDRSATAGYPAWCRGAATTTDAHLFSLAADHRAKLATLDTGIVGAFLLPRA